MKAQSEDSARTEAEVVLLDRRLFVLDDEKYQQFLELLDAPPTVNENLRKLLNCKPPWEEER